MKKTYTLTRDELLWIEEIMKDELDFGIMFAVTLIEKLKEINAKQKQDENEHPK